MGNNNSSNKNTSQTERQIAINEHKRGVHVVHDERIGCPICNNNNNNNKNSYVYYFYR